MSLCRYLRDAYSCVHSSVSSLTLGVMFTGRWVGTTNLFEEERCVREPP
jgi:hypothetical protein